MLLLTNGWVRHIKYGGLDKGGIDCSGLAFCWSRRYMLLTFHA